MTHHDDRHLPAAILTLVCLLGAAMIVLLVLTSASGAHRHELLTPATEKPLRLDANGDPTVLGDLSQWLVGREPTPYDVTGDGVPDYVVVFLLNSAQDHGVLLVYDATGGFSQTSRCVHYAILDLRTDPATVVEWAGDRDWEHHAVEVAS